MLKILPIDTPELLEHALPLVDAYQEFYGFESNRERNRSFFQKFMGSEEARQFLALLEEKAVGFATVYFMPSSLSGNRYAVMNDLYTIPMYRGLGIGKKLIDACARFVKERGYASIDWQTQVHNVGAQKLYDRLGARKSQWFNYSLGT